MTIIRRPIQMIRELREWSRPIGRELLGVYQEQRISRMTSRAFCIGLTASALVGSGLPLKAWAADPTSFEPTIPITVVAAGVGYENAETSTITVKTYDAESGEILSEETYELNVREDAALADSQPRERIFAGGVGPGTDGLSSFALRAYDKATGQFLWEGLLNLDVDNQESASVHRAATRLVAPQATVTRVHSRVAVDGQPQFFLRSIDSATGQTVWVDRFSTGTGFARAEYVSRAFVGQTGEMAPESQQIEFQIRMMDEQGRKIIWEDTIEPIVAETDVVAEHDGAAEILPAWRGTGFEGNEYGSDLI
ncbi:MAG TPA: hypothetical protein VLA67_12400 [Nitrospiraceae bacterium]|nr:hypothetical protein [Nitrospiraceae bacterium]